MKRRRRKLRKNISALISFFLLIISAFLFPLFENNIFGETLSNKSIVIINLFKDVFSNFQIYFNSWINVSQFLLVIIFLLIGILYLLNGLGIIYNRYSRYASFLTFVYFIIGLIVYNFLNSQNSLSLFGFEITSLSIGPGIYFVPIIGILYLIFVRRINSIIRV